eukprot:3936131-Rhodomonas_salina.1
MLRPWRLSGSAAGLPCHGGGAAARAVTGIMMGAVAAALRLSQCHGGHGLGSGKESGALQRVTVTTTALRLTRTARAIP